MRCWHSCRAGIARRGERLGGPCPPYVVIVVILLIGSSARAASGWFDDSFRRPVDVIWEAERGSGTDVCYIEFYTGGHVNADGSDIRVSNLEGRQVPARVLRVGPGDRVSVIFQLLKNERKYYVYFGNPKPPANRPAMEDVKIETGLLLDMHEWNGMPVENFAQIQAAWEKAGPLIGRTMVDGAFYGINPFGAQERTVS